MTAQRAEQPEQTVPLPFAEQLVTQILFGEDCEIATQGGAGRCIEEAVAMRYEHGFVDGVCETHAEHAIGRGAVVVFAKRPSAQG